MSPASQNPHPLVAVYTLAYNQCNITKLLVGDLIHQKYPVERYEIIILDDGSADETLEEVSHLVVRSPVTVKLLHYRHEGDYLSARRWNQCIQVAEPSVEVFVQIDDVRVRPDFITQHAKWHSSYEDWLVTGAKFEADRVSWDLSTCRRRSLAGIDGAASEVFTCKAIWGASLSFTRRAMDKVFRLPYDVPYDERMTGWGYHEVEFALRMQRAGVRLIYDPAAGVFHRNHVKETEVERGLHREELIRDGERRNVQYILDKHGLEKIESW